MVISVSSPPVAVAASRAWAHCRTHSRLWGTLKTGGESGIRTHVRVSPKHAFQACAFSHSAISPALCPERMHHAWARRKLLRSAEAQNRSASRFYGDATAGATGHQL